MALVDDTPYTENVVIDFEFSRMRCMFFEEEWIIEKMMLKNCDKNHFAIFLEKVAPTAIPFTVVSSVSAVSKPVEQINYFDKSLTRCKIFSCETSALQTDRLQYPNRRIHIALYPKEDQTHLGAMGSRNKKLSSKDTSEDSNVGCDEAGIKNLSFDIANLLAKCHLSDVTLTTGDKTIGAHKCILSARSEVFKAMFEHDMTEKQNNTVDIQDVDYEVLEIFVQYLYTGKFPVVTVSIASNLYIVADKYAVGELKMKCATFLSSNLLDENVLSILSLADCFSDEMLKKKSFNFVLENKEFLISEQWFLFRDQNPKLACEVYAFYVENAKSTSQMPMKYRGPPKQVYHQRLRFPEPINQHLSLLD